MKFLSKHTRQVYKEHGLTHLKKQINLEVGVLWSFPRKAV